MLTRQSDRKLIEPWKYFDSVMTEMPAAPPIVYVRASARCSSVAISRPFDGDAFLISAMICEPLAAGARPTRPFEDRTHKAPLLRRDAILPLPQGVERLLQLARFDFDALVGDDLVNDAHLCRTKSLELRTYAWKPATSSLSPETSDQILPGVCCLDEGGEALGCGTGIDALLRHADARAQIAGGAPRDERSGGVDQREVAQRARRAIEHELHLGGVLLGCASAQEAYVMPRQTDILRSDAECPQFAALPARRPSMAR